MRVASIVGPVGAAVLCLFGWAASAATVTACPSIARAAVMPGEAVPRALAKPDWLAHLASMRRDLSTRDLRSVDVLLLGDSIMQNWPPSLLAALFGSRVLNLGLGGDRTESLLWRLGSLPLGETLKPRLVVVLVGTNDLSPSASVSDIALGVATIVRQVRARVPASRILVLGLLPRDRTSGSPLRPVEAQVNRLLVRCVDGETISVTAPGGVLLDPGGLFPVIMSLDAIHPTLAGYERLTKLLEPVARGLMAR